MRRFTVSMTMTGEGSSLSPSSTARAEIGHLSVAYGAPRIVACLRLEDDADRARNGGSSRAGRHPASREAPLEDGGVLFERPLELARDDPKLRRVGGRFSDVTRPDEVGALVQTALDRFGGLDIAFNNAGVTHPAASTAALDDDNFRFVMDVNVRGVWLGMKAQIRVPLSLPERSPCPRPTRTPMTPPGVPVQMAEEVAAWDRSD